VLEPKPVSRPRPTVYAGGESETARDLIARTCDAYVMHGDPPDDIAGRVADMTARRDRTGRSPLTFGVAAYAIVRDSEREARHELERITDVSQSAAGYGNYQQWIANTQLERRVSLEDYSVSNRGLRSGLVGTPERVIAQVQAFDDAGVDLLLLQCSPQIEEMERFSEQVIRPYREARASAVAAAIPGLPAGLAEGIRGW
jgi:FMNH2-dependent dimethyl sulfone monooxygenase